MKFDIITIFPNIFDSYLNESILKRAQKKKLISVRVHDLRKYSKSKHKRVDDRPFGGGPGMVLQIEPIARIFNKFGSKKQNKVIIFSASGKRFDDKSALRLAKSKTGLVMLCGHYEGIDERAKTVIKDLGFKIEEISIGPYVLTGGELPAMVLLDAVSRKIPGVLGKNESLEEQRYGVGVPAYTRPAEFTYKNKKYKVPGVLLSGNHKKIEEWRKTGKKGL